MWRRYSPSDTAWKPKLSCFSTISLTAASSTVLRFCSKPFSPLSILCLTAKRSEGRRREPKCSALNGGLWGDVEGILNYNFCGSCSRSTDLRFQIDRMEKKRKDWSKYACQIHINAGYVQPQHIQLRRSLAWSLSLSLVTTDHVLTKNVSTNNADGNKKS